MSSNDRPGLINKERLRMNRSFVPVFSALFFVVIAMAGLSLVNAGNGMEIVGRAMDAYWAADYKDAIRLLDTVEPDAMSRPERTLFFKVRGLALFALGDREGAKTAFQELLDSDPVFRLDPGEFSPSVIGVFDEVRFSKGRELSTSAMKAYEAGRYGEALGLFEKALEMNPKDPVARDFRGLTEAKVAAMAPTPTPTPLEPIVIVRPNSCQIGVLDPGERIYTDRGYVLAEIPGQYHGLHLVRTPNSAKKDRGFALDLQLAKPAQVFVAYDSRVKERPPWLMRFSETGARIKVIEIRGNKKKTRKYDVFERRESAGAVTFGSNLEAGVKGKGMSMYFVFLRLTDR